MKRSIGIIIFSLVFFACEPTELPAPTNNGSDTFGMLVNGEKWIAYQPGMFTPGTNSADIMYFKNSSALVIYARTKKPKQSFYATVNITKVGSYPFNKILYSEQDSTYVKLITSFCEDENCNDRYTLIDSINSRINITKFDTLNRIVSGTFYMRLLNSNGNNVEIKDGRFDSKFDIYYE